MGALLSFVAVSAVIFGAAFELCAFLIFAGIAVDGSRAARALESIAKQGRAE